MPRILTVTKSDHQGRRIEARLRATYPDAVLDVVHGWRGMIAGFGESYPRALLIDLRLAEDGGPGQVRSVRKSAPWLPVIVLGDPSRTSGRKAIALMKAGVTAFVAPEEFHGSDRLRAALNGDGRLVGQVLEALRRHRDPLPLPAELVAVLEVALARRPGGLDVKGLAARLGQSESSLRRMLRDLGAPSPGVLLRWCRALWAVSDLTTQPHATAETVAYELGFSGTPALGNVLSSCLGTRVRGTRTLGLEGAIATFVRKFATRT
jgi:AraC-like DNA-binding protein